jgi:hypothetical protein
MIYVKGLLTGFLVFAAVLTVGIMSSIGSHPIAANSSGLEAVAGGVSEWLLAAGTLAFAGAFIWHLRRASRSRIR